MRIGKLIAVISPLRVHLMPRVKKTIGLIFWARARLMMTSVRNYTFGRTRNRRN